MLTSKLYHLSVENVLQHVEQTIQLHICIRKWRAVLPNRHPENVVLRLFEDRKLEIEIHADVPQAHTEYAQDGHPKAPQPKSHQRELMYDMESCHMDVLRTKLLQRLQNSG